MSDRERTGWTDYHDGYRDVSTRGLPGPGLLWACVQHVGLGPARRIVANKIRGTVAGEIVETLGPFASFEEARAAADAKWSPG